MYIYRCIERMADSGGAARQSWGETPSSMEVKPHMIFGLVAIDSLICVDVTTQYGSAKCQLCNLRSKCKLM